VRRVDPKYTSRRCSKCGFIHAEFTREFRDANRQGGATTRFRCPECEYEADPDYNAARNLATLDIEKLIVQQCERQSIALS
jgi:transposase